MGRVLVEHGTSCCSPTAFHCKANRRSAREFRNRETKCITEDHKIPGNNEEKPASEATIFTVFCSVRETDFDTPKCLYKNETRESQNRPLSTLPEVLMASQ